MAFGATASKLRRSFGLANDRCCILAYLRGSRNHVTVSYRRLLTPESDMNFSRVSLDSYPTAASLADSRLGLDYRLNEICSISMRNQCSLPWNAKSSPIICEPPLFPIMGENVKPPTMLVLWL